MSVPAFDLSALHLLRPHWLWALLALPAMFALWRVRRRRGSVWQGNVDAHLLPHLLATHADARARRSWIVGVLAYVLAVIALAGPSWRLSPQPLWQSRAPLVVVLDLSSAALASDLPPTRLAQARAKIGTLLRERQGGQVALVVFADDAFTVAPLTEDAGNVALFLDSLDPDIMPVDGQRADRAIDASVQLLRQGGFDRGAIVLMTDHADDAARDAAAAAARQGYRVDVLGLGTAQGASYRRGDGTFAQARLDAGSLRAVAAAGGGRSETITADDRDLQALRVLLAGATDDAELTGKHGQVRQDDGYWLLPPLMLLALFAFRRRGALAVLVLCIGWPQAHAADWWQRDDQKQHARMEQGNDAYRSGDFAGAASQYQGVDSADGHYNRGNALAKAGQYPEAIAAYEEALRRQPGMEDAIANKRAVEAAMKRKPPQGGGQGQQDAPQKNRDKQDQGGQGTGSPQSKPDSRQPRQPQSQPSDKQDQAAQQPEPDAAEKQRQADAAQRERMQRALEQQGRERPQPAQARPDETPQQREQRLANEAWLRRVPDDPGGLLREKFRIEHERRQSGGGKP